MIADEMSIVSPDFRGVPGIRKILNRRDLVVKSSVIFAFACVASAAGSASSGQPQPSIFQSNGVPERRADFLAHSGNVFDALDDRRKGSISRAELRAKFFAPTLKMQNPVPFPLNPVEFSCVDLNRDKQISKREYLQFATSVFDFLDSKHSGSLNLADYRQRLKFIDRLRATGKNCGR
ncbi:MAG: EF-hand domain-containing protein [Sphingomicrobium sp.]